MPVDCIWLLSPKETYNAEKLKLHGVRQQPCAGEAPLALIGEKHLSSVEVCSRRHQKYFVEFFMRGAVVGNTPKQSKNLLSDLQRNTQGGHVILKMFRTLSSIEGWSRLEQNHPCMAGTIIQILLRSCYLSCLAVLHLRSQILQNRE